MSQMVIQNNNTGGGSLNTSNSILDIIGLPAAVAIIGIIAFLGMSIFTGITSLFIPTITKISSWQLAANELKACMFLSMENILIAVLLGVIKECINKKRSKKIA